MSPLARFLQGLVYMYRWGVSPLLPPRCRYLPTCSEYTLEALRLHGAVHGGYLALRRILRCHPWGGCGYDPVPRKTQKNTKNDVNSPGNVAQRWHH